MALITIKPRLRSRTSGARGSAQGWRDGEREGRGVREERGMKKKVVGRRRRRRRGRAAAQEQDKRGQRHSSGMEGWRDRREGGRAGGEAEEEEEREKERGEGTRQREQETWRKRPKQGERKTGRKKESGFTERRKKRSLT